MGAIGREAIWRLLQKGLGTKEKTPGESAVDPQGRDPMEDKAEAQGSQSEVAEGRQSVEGRGGQCSQEALLRLLRATS